MSDEQKRIEPAPSFANRESRTPAPIEPCADCGHVQDDPDFHFDAPGKNWGAALHWFRAPAPAEQAHDSAVCSIKGNCLVNGAAPAPDKGNEKHGLQSHVGIVATCLCGRQFENLAQFNSHLTLALRRETLREVLRHWREQTMHNSILRFEDWLVEQSEKE